MSGVDWPYQPYQPYQPYHYCSPQAIQEPAPPPSRRVMPVHCTWCGVATDRLWQHFVDGYAWRGAMCSECSIHLLIIADHMTVREVRP